MRIRRVSVPCVRHGWKLISASCVAQHAAIICLVRIIIELAYRSGGPIAVRQRFERPERLQATKGVEPMALKMNTREVDGIAVVGLDGRVVLGDESNALREQVKKMLAAGKKKIGLDMSNVSYIDSAGLGTLVAAHHSARTPGASLKLSNLGKKFQEILQVTKLLTVFDVYPSESAAISSFGH